MALLFDLNDLGIRCYSNGRLLHESPGVALTDGEQLLFGEQALRNSRSRPLHCFSRFWSQLDVHPIASGNPKVRHHADLAYLHLQHIQNRIEQPREAENAILMLSGQTDRQALGLLLGIARQCGLQVVGIVDTSLACLLPLVRTSRSMHVEMHLHHTIISQLELFDGRLQLHNLEVLPKLGWLDLQQHLLRYLSNQFIRQTRFNPRHDAGNEQLLFDALPVYLQSAESQRVIECQLPGSTLQMNARDLCDEVESWLQPLSQKLLLAARQETVFIGDHLSQLGMFLPTTLRATHLTKEQVGAALTELGDKLEPGTDGLRFTRSLSCTLRTDEVTDEPATHILHNSRAYPLAGTWSLLNRADAPLQAGAHPEAIALLRNNRITLLNSDELQFNGQHLSGEHELQRGDRLSLRQHGTCLQMIKVEG